MSYFNIFYIFVLTGYVAPESSAWNGLTKAQRKKASERPGLPADIWSVGCIVYEVNFFS